MSGAGGGATAVAPTGAASEGAEDVHSDDDELNINPPTRLNSMSIEKI